MPSEADVHGMRPAFSRAAFPCRATNLPASISVDRLAQLVDGHGVVQPGVVQRVAEFLAQHAGQLAAAGHQGAAGRAGVVGGHVEHVDRAVIGRLEDAAAASSRVTTETVPLCTLAGSSPVATLKRLLKARTRAPAVSVTALARSK